VSPCARAMRGPKKALVGRTQCETHPGHPKGNVYEQARKDHLTITRVSSTC
jgi:hypothetical protein